MGQTSLRLIKGSSDAASMRQAQSNVDECSEFFGYSLFRYTVGDDITA
jgi:hypothetical protein